MKQLQYILPGEPIPRGSFFHQRRYRVALAMTDNLQGGGSLLDIGCGNASQTEFFAQHVDYAIGIDLQHHRLAEFHDELDRSNAENITLIGGSAQRLPFRDETFDCITCFEMLEHVPDQAKVLNEIHRVLKPEGRIILSVPHRWWIFETHGADLPLLPWNRVPFFSWLPKKIHDAWARARIYTESEIRKIIGESGFKEVQAKLLTAPMDVVKNERLQQLLRKTIFRGDTTTIPFLSSTIFASAKKST
ncbi:hypothetical protein CEE37_01530 [candidate division LCP-89 bacterium B3_LCP]|uniref:Methyltransferase type 11 domain-containing protein n=1 Tax=candidate division LCP-89 bacterium B3_LCP TaxID=2012998 RepID=A0A532V5B7_UNCL8|nr:MAG: hypothetical protein CEE37_01530 [candidate division LCP-89 bacterium B3_LCP]